MYTLPEIGGRTQMSPTVGEAGVFRSMGMELPAGELRVGDFAPTLVLTGVLLAVTWGITTDAASTTAAQRSSYCRCT